MHLRLDITFQTNSSNLCGLCNFNLIYRGYLRVVCRLFMTILYIPAIAIFVSMLTGCSEGDGHGGHHVYGPDRYASCWTDAYIFRSLIVILVCVIFILLTLTFAMSVFQQDPTDKKELLNRPHSRIEVSQIIAKTILTALFVMFEGDDA